MKTLLTLLLAPVLLQAQTSFPSLTIPISSRAMAMGGQSDNIAGSAHLEHAQEASVFYTPYLAGISPEIKFIHAGYSRGIGESSALSLAIGYLNLGNTLVKDDYGASIASFKSNEYSICASYALQVIEGGSLGATLRFVGSQAAAFQQPGSYSVAIKSKGTVCGDLGYIQRLTIGDENSLRIGAYVNNLGAKDAQLPSAAGISVGYEMAGEEGGNRLEGELTVEEPLVSGSSFQNLRAMAGIEYGFGDQFFLRGGVSLENKLKGDRKYFSLGVGFKGSVKDDHWGIDFHYLVPFGVVPSESPFQNSYGFGLFIGIGSNTQQ